MSKILVIEDDPLYLESIETILKLNDYNVISETNGFDGIKTAIKELPDLIISDINLPEKSGYEVLGAIRQDFRTMNIPFIFMSALSKHEDIRAGMVLGAEDYITKPFKYDELLNSIQTRLKRKRNIDKYYQEKIEKFRQNISKMIPHEMRTPLSGIIGLSEYLINEITSLEKDEISELIQHINNSSKRLYNVISRYVLYSSLLIENNSDEEFKVGNLNASSDLIKEFISDIIKQNNVSFDFKFDFIERCEIFISYEYFNRIIIELIENTIKFSFSNTQIICRTYIENNYFNLYIKNFGRGFEPHEVADIGAFTQFNRDKFEQQGVGLGLILVKMITELHNGKFKIDSLFGSYVEITISLPLEKK